MDFDAAGLLDGLEGDERIARERLLARLAGDGFGLEELRGAAAEDRLALLPVERAPGECFTASEVAERTGLAPEMLLRARRPLGLPEAAADESVFGEQDIAAASALRRFLDAGLGEEAIAEVTRVLGEAMARVAATTSATFAEAFLKAGDSEDDVATRFASLTVELKPALAPVIVAAFDAHLRETVRRAMIGRDELEAGSLAGAENMAVGFADLVGFTRLGVEAEAKELGSVAGALARLATDVTEPPVQLVKTIGDAAMFVSPDAVALVAAALSLLEAAEAANLPSLRAGIALGAAIAKAGDWYGHPVNLASRVTAIARPDSVLCSAEVREAASEEFRWSFAGRRRLKGVGQAVPLHRARRLAVPEPSTASSSEKRRSRRPGAA